MFSVGKKSNKKIECLIYLIIHCLVYVVAYGENPNLSSSITRASFPPSFLFGTASSAYQYEGAAAEDGKKPSVLDTFIKKNPDRIKDGTDASVADDQYHRYKEDVAIMKDLGFKVYRLSISWPRVLPNGGLSGGINQPGINYYNNLINELVSNGIEPVVTLFHWDGPQALEDQYLSFLSPKIINDFRDYAELCFKKFGDRVKIWLTLNEPFTYTTAYSSGFFAPGRCSDRAKCAAGNSSTEPYIVGHHQLLAHSAAVRLYKEKYQKTQKGEIGIALSATWMIPYSNSSQDIVATDRALAFQFGWFMNPLHSGSYPIEMIERVGQRLPKFSEDEAKMLKGSYDFIGINYYTSSYAADKTCQTTNLNFGSDTCVNVTSERNGVPIGQKAGPWVYVYPEGLRQFLLYMKTKYKDPEIYITENGVVDDPKVAADSVFLNDDSRIEYYQNHLSNLHKAMMEGVKVKGYMAWSFLDNFEWSEGYTSRFGVVHVDYKNGLKRTPKKSALWFKSFLNSAN